MTRAALYARYSFEGQRVPKGTTHLSRRHLYERYMVTDSNSLHTQHVNGWREGSWRRSALQPELPYGLLDFLETGRTVGVREREREHGRTHAMGLAIRPLTYPALETSGCSCLVLNESAGTTGGEQRRRDVRVSPRNRRRLMCDLSEQGFKKHMPHLSVTRQAKKTPR